MVTSSGFPGATTHQTAGLRTTLRLVDAYSLPELPYDYAALEPHYDARTVELHHDKHHAAYVKGANTTFEKLGEARDSGEFDRIVGLQRTLAFNVSGHVLHSLFWPSMSRDGGGEPEGELAAAIRNDFGSFEGFKAQLTQATSTVQGSGWGALLWEPMAGSLVIAQIYDHQDSYTAGGMPLLAIDAWEHAYYLQFQNERPKWIEAFWRIVNWPVVAERFADARGVGLTDVG
jgi:Fe-Mn family superoxide dismutase